MTEIEKMFENFKIEQELSCNRDNSTLCDHIRPDGKSRLTFGCYDCEYLNDKYPCFHEKKQFKLLKYLLTTKICEKQKMVIYYRDNCYCIETKQYRYKSSCSFAKALAIFVNSTFNLFTKEEKLKIKEILYG